MMQRGRNLRKWLLGEIQKEGEIDEEFHKTRELHKGYKEGVIHNERLIHWGSDHREIEILKDGVIHKEGVKNEGDPGTAGYDQKDRVGRAMVDGVLVNTIQKYFSLVPKLVR